MIDNDQQEPQPDVCSRGGMAKVIGGIGVAILAIVGGIAKHAGHLGRGVGRHADDVIRGVGQNADDLGRGVGRHTDDFARGLGNHSDDFTRQFGRQSHDFGPVVMPHAEGISAKSASAAEDVFSVGRQGHAMANEEMAATEGLEDVGKTVAGQERSESVGWEVLHNGSHVVRHATRLADEREEDKKREKELNLKAPQAEGTEAGEVAPLP
jgi:hypothetical protein